MKKYIEAKKLSFTYPDGTPAISNITFTLYQGEKVGLVGPNGAGKSTLLFSLMGLLPAQGELKLWGMKVTAQSRGALWKRVGLLFQNPDDQLFMPTVEEDVAFAPRNLGWSSSIVQAKVEKALTATGTEALSKRSPVHLSLGQKRLVAIATLLSYEPELLLLDEPTSQLDPASHANIVCLLSNLSQTMLIASHDEKLIAEVTDRTIHLDYAKSKS